MSSEASFRMGVRSGWTPRVESIADTEIEAPQPLRVSRPQPSLRSATPRRRRAPTPNPTPAMERAPSMPPTYSQVGADPVVERGEPPAGVAMYTLTEEDFQNAVQQRLAEATAELETRMARLSTRYANTNATPVNATPIQYTPQPMWQAGPAVQVHDLRPRARRHSHSAPQPQYTPTVPVRPATGSAVSTSTHRSKQSSVGSYVATTVAVDAAGRKTKTHKLVAGKSGKVGGFHYLFT